MKKLIIETDKLKNNIERIKSMTASTIIAVLKGNGYGLGIIPFARLLSSSGIDFFAVSEIQEALILRKSGIEGRILLLTPTSMPDEVELILTHDIIPTVGSVNSAVAINEAAKKLETVADVHLKIDTGFGRFGFLPEQLDTLYSLLKSLDCLKVTGTYSHFSFSFAKKSRAVFMQFERFMKCVERLKGYDIEPGMLHIANSCAFLQYENLHLDAARIGSGFLGRVPIENKYGLQKIGFLESRIIELKDLPANCHIGYANTYKTKKPVRIGVVPVGYKDGFGIEKSRDTFRLRDILRYIYNDLKLFRKHLYVRVNGRKARILGRVSMYNIIVDLTGSDAKIGDDVFLDINPVLIEGSITREYF